MQDPAKFGFYQVGELKFYSKLEAIELHQRTGIHPHWNFNDQVYSSYDWRQEPKESLSELYRQRAQQLRDSYDYLVLWYSGGADCDNILHAFVDNDILLDEAASYVNFDATKDKFDATNGEIFNVAYPKLQKIREIAPHLTHRVIDFCQLTIDWFSNGTNQDWMYQLNTIATASNASRQEIYKLVPEWQKMIDRGLRIGFITGIDKPRIVQNPDSSYVFRFIDIIDNGCTANQQQTNPDWFHPEFFYWTPDAPKIVIKQTHVIKNYLKQATQHSAWINKKRSDLAYKIIDGERWWLSQDGMHTLLYPKWQAIPYQIKPQSALFVFRDDWFRQLNDDNLAFKVYRMGVEKRWTMVPDYWKNDPANIHKGYKCCYSREYNVGQ
jgi:hypothetical protein